MQNNKEILKDNKLIASFMMEKGSLSTPDMHFSCDKRKISSITIDDITDKEDIEYMHYHDQWDWLMPVVEKIWDIIGNRSSLFHFEYEDELITSYEDYTTNIMDCWNAVIKFIKWYNNEQKKIL